MSFSIGNKTTFYDKKSGKQVEKHFMNLRFIDSFGFMSSSLSQLVLDLKQNGLNNFKNVSQKFGLHTELMTRKCIYPYSFMDSFEKFDVDPLSLTNYDFRNDLTGEDISDCDYEFYKEICVKFNKKS